MRKYKEINVKITNELSCDKCGIKALKGDYEYHEFISIDHACGYGSIHEDGKQLQVDICQHCFADILGDCLHLSEQSKPCWTSFFEGEKASDDFMAERFEVISEKGAASGILKNITNNLNITDEDSLNDALEE